MRTLERPIAPHEVHKTRVHKAIITDPWAADAVRAIVKALAVPRNRFGKLETDAHTGAAMREFVRACELPHGGLDAVDQACMILQRLIGEEPSSILDAKK